MKNSIKKEKSFSHFLKGTDFLTLLGAMIASAYGLSLVYSATYSSLTDGRVVSSDVRSMLVSVAGGLIIAIAVSNIDYEIISKLWPIIAAGCVGLMIFTFFFGVSPASRQDARSWLDLKIFYFQPSELLKVGFIISFSYHLDLVKDKLNKLKTIIPLVIHGAIPVGLVLLTGDAGSALIFLMMFIGMLFLAKVNIGYFVAGICAIIVGFVVAWKAGIITVAGEELGFVGAIFVILVLGYIILRVMKTALRARDNVGYLMCSGIAVMLFAQVVVNVGMELSLLPCIGITLPLFSAGGSSSLCIYLAIGLELSIYRYSRRPSETLFYTR